MAPPFIISAPHYRDFESLYLGNESRYSDEWKSGFDSMIPCTFWTDFDDKIFYVFSRCLHKNSQRLCKVCRLIVALIEQESNTRETILKIEMSLQFFFN